MILKFRHKLQGGHVHVRVFTGDNPDALAKAGDLTFRPDEWDQFKKWHSLAASTVQLTRVDQAAGLTYDIYFVDDSDYPLPDLPDDLLLIPLLDHDQRVILCDCDQFVLWYADDNGPPLPVCKCGHPNTEHINETGSCTGESVRA